MSREERQAWPRLNAEVIACTRCPRLVEWRERAARDKKRAFRDWDYWGRPLPGFGDPKARLVIIGLAPAAHGGNRTGRMFTGDGSADTLMAALHRTGFANQPTSVHRDDGLELRDAYMTAAVRCAPPANRPTPQEMVNCRPFLARELELLRNVKVVLALGRLAFEGYLRLLRQQGREIPRLAFRHGAIYSLGPSLPVLVACYHPSRQNTQTGRLTAKMLDQVLARIRAYL